MMMIAESILKIDLSNWAFLSSSLGLQWEKRKMEKTKRASPLLILVLLTLVIGGAIAAVQYFARSLQHKDTVSFEVLGMDALLLEPDYNAYLAQAPEMTTVDNMTFITGDYIKYVGDPDPPINKVIREMILVYTDTNVISPNLTVTVGNLPEGIEVDIRIAWYYYHLAGGNPAAKIGDEFGTTSSHQQSLTGIYFDVVWDDYLEIENGVEYNISPALFADMQYDTTDEGINPCGLVIHISTPILNGYQGPHTGWGIFFEDVYLDIDVVLSGGI